MDQHNDSEMLQYRFLEPCDVPVKQVKIKPFVMVIFAGAPLTQTIYGFILMN